MNDKELKPCPCCKGKADVHVDDSTGNNILYFVYCTVCDLATNSMTHRVDAVNIWNTRPDEWDLKEWPVQTHIRSKTMDEHIEKIKCLFGDKLSPWIKITPETMPKDEKPVWIYYTYKTNGNSYTGQAFLSKGVWFSDDGETTFGLDEVTHYMPIPERSE